MCLGRVLAYKMRKSSESQYSHLCESELSFEDAPHLNCVCRLYRTFVDGAFIYIYRHTEIQ